MKSEDNFAVVFAQYLTHIAGPSRVRGRIKHGPLAEQAEQLTDVALVHLHICDPSVVMHIEV